MGENARPDNQASNIEGIAEIQKVHVALDHLMRKHNPGKDNRCNESTNQSWYWSAKEGIATLVNHVMK